jgi:hypothetical protein
MASGDAESATNGMVLDDTPPRISSTVPCARGGKPQMA